MLVANGAYISAQNTVRSAEQSLQAAQIRLQQLQNLIQHHWNVAAHDASPLRARSIRAFTRARASASMGA